MQDFSQLFCADLTHFNPNVLFELGYAIARKKRIWLILDSSLEESRKIFEQMRILTTVGYISYCNSIDIIQGFYKDQPYSDLSNSIYEMSIVPALGTPERETLLYLKARHNTEAAVRMSNNVDKFKIPLTIDDPRESSVQPLSWYVRKILTSLGVLVHFSSPGREGALLHNSRYAFVSGLAYGFQKKLLILSEAEYESPIDYRDIHRTYRDATECTKLAMSWLEGVSVDYSKLVEKKEEYHKKTALVIDLKHLRLGEYIAENEEDDLDNYFIETSSFLETLAGRHTLVVGRKGSRKTANLFVIAKRLGADKRNLVCVIKPVSYELESIVRLLKKYTERDEKGYVVESLWKFLLYTEIANTVAAQIETRPYSIIPASPEERLLKLLAENGGELRQEFGIRLERAVNALFSIPLQDTVEYFRLAISEGLHAGILRELRMILGEVLTGRNRVAVLVDNLDKAWDKRNDLEALTAFLLGLLRVSRDIRQEFTKKDPWRKPISLTLTIFLRSDIFAILMKMAREPDKIAYSKLVWNDPETLLRVIDERVRIGRGGDIPSPDIWKDIFCPTVKGTPVREYLIEHVLPRPRDIVFFVSSAIAAAVNRGHAYVEEEDILGAEKQYSQFVFESIQVENGISVPQLEAILYEFAGQKATLEEKEVLNLTAKAGIPDPRRKLAIRHLCALSFLGVEVKPGIFTFSAEEEEAQKNEVLAKNLAETRGGKVFYKVNTSFHSFLEIT